MCGLVVEFFLCGCCASAVIPLSLSWEPKNEPSRRCLFVYVWDWKRAIDALKWILSLLAADSINTCEDDRQGCWRRASRVEEESHCPLLNNRSHQWWDGVWTSLLWEKVTADEELCPQSAFGYAWCSVAEKNKTITNQRLDKSTPHTLLVLESCQGALRRVSHSDSLIGVIHSVTSKTGEGGGRAGKLWHATAEFPLRSRDADRVTYFPHWAELQEYSCSAFIGREPSTCPVGLSPQNFEPPTLVNTQSL